MIELITTTSFWAFSLFWLIGYLMFLTVFTDIFHYDITFYQFLFLLFFSGPMGWALTAVLVFIAGLVWFWKFLGKHDLGKNP